jgi:hypothetical protein
MGSRLVFVVDNVTPQQRLWQGLMEEQACENQQCLHDSVYYKSEDGELKPMRSIMIFLIRLFFEKNRGTVQLMKTLLEFSKASLDALENNKVYLDILTDKQLTLMYQNTPYIHSILKTKLTG